MTLTRSVRTKVLGAFLAVLTLFIGVLGLSLIRMQTIAYELTVLQDRYLELTKAVSSLETNREVLDRYGLDRFQRDRGAAFNLYSPIIDSHALAMRGLLAQCRDLLDSTRLPAADEEDLEDLAALQSGVNSALAAFGRFTRALTAAKEAQGELGDAALQEAALQEALALQRQSLSDFGQALDDLSAELDRGAGAALKSARQNLAQARLAVAGMSAVAVILGLTMLGLIYRALRPIGRLTEGVKMVRQGEYGSRVEIESRDEIGLLAAEFNAMAASLEERDKSLQEKRRELEAANASIKRTNADLRSLSIYNSNILHSISVGLLACDRSGRVTTANPGARALFEGPDTPLLGLDVEVIPGLDEEALVRRVLENGRILRREGVGHQTPKGESVLLDITLVPLVGEETQGVEGVILLAEDVTERTAIRHRLALSERLALIGKMSAQVTHEIRNPLNALGLNAELLEEEIQLLDPREGIEAKVLLSSISKEIDRLTEITEQYLSLARLPKPSLEPEDVGDVALSVARFVSVEAESRDITLTSEVEGPIPEVLADESQIRQALLNILRNSVEATGQGGEVSIKVRALRGGVEIAIADQGPGMSPALIPRIFDPFFSTKQRGTGLGLPITQQIIEEHRGRITCESQEGEGTTFLIWLPGTHQPLDLGRDLESAHG